MLWNWLAYLQRHLVWAIPAVMGVGLLFGAIWDATPLKRLILPITILMIYPVMVALDIRELIARCRWSLLVLVQLMNLIVLPLLGWALGRLFFTDSPVFAFGLLLVALLPTSGMTISWTKFARGDVSAAIKMTILGLVLGAALAPLYVRLLLGRSVQMPLGPTYANIVLVIFLPLVGGLLTQLLLVRWVGRDVFARRWKPRFPTISTVAVLAIIFVAVAVRARAVLDAPGELLGLIPPLLLFYALAYVIVGTVGRLALPSPAAITLVYSTVMRNLSLALAMAMTVFGTAGAPMALVIALAYVIQVQSAAWFVRLASRFFPAETTVPVAPPA